MAREIIFDLESNGLLPTMDRIHCLVARDAETRETWRFRKNHDEDTIEQAVAMLHDLEPEDTLVGHNIIQFDLKAIKKIYPDFAPVAKMRDTLVLTRLLTPDIAKKDYARVKAHKMPGRLAGRHSLEAWGYRLGKHKGDYTKIMQERGLDPWAQWTGDMEDYCENDVDVTEIIWSGCKKDMPGLDVIELETDVHALAGRMQDNGFPFDVAGAQALANKVRADHEVALDEAKKYYGSWFAPVKKWQIAPMWDDPNGANNAKSYKEPRAEYGEDHSRRFWGDVAVPKRSIVPSDPTKPAREVGAPYCPIKRVDFNPGSRHQVIDRFVTVHDWEPSDFTEAGSPSVDDAVLNALADSIPMAKTLAEIFFQKKLLGMLESGASSWLHLADDKGFIHPSTNTAGAVTRRCTHFSPNIAQVPKVITKERKLADGTKEKYVLYGRAGKYGYECRQLFHVPTGWKQVGVDLSGIELRCLANLCAEFDGGELIEVVLNGDPHQFNMDKTGVENRDIAKRLLYALMYGAGDLKLGITAYPNLPRAQQVAIGTRLRAQFMEGLPALKKAIKKIMTEADKGWIKALDGGKLVVRAKYAALNTRLQSDGALLAKRWAVFTEEMMLDDGHVNSWDGDFAMLAFIHDELQSGVLDQDGLPEKYAAYCVKAANLSGQSFGDAFVCPVDAQAKIGNNWAQCH